MWQNRLAAQLEAEKEPFDEAETANSLGRDAIGVAQGQPRAHEGSSAASGSSGSERSSDDEGMSEAAEAAEGGEPATGPTSSRTSAMAF
eukprot:SAG11_NODE_2114_length_3798_cov_9.451473_1_plen_89_part_00